MFGWIRNILSLGDDVGIAALGDIIGRKTMSFISNTSVKAAAEVVNEHARKLFRRYSPSSVATSEMYAQFANIMAKIEQRQPDKAFAISKWYKKLSAHQASDVVISIYEQTCCDIPGDPEDQKNKVRGEREELVIVQLMAITELPERERNAYAYMIGWIKLKESDYGFGQSQNWIAKNLTFTEEQLVQMDEDNERARIRNDELWDRLLAPAPPGPITQFNAWIYSQRYRFLIILGAIVALGLIYLAGTAFIAALSHHSKLAIATLAIASVLALVGLATWRTRYLISVTAEQPANNNCGTPANAGPEEL